ncbi:putative protein N(5)-glutamine methyltransferase [Nocardia arizonensis]|uniref:putative protein N(5)-glutamine methyltransferase n=1 Tax=Nocardia arizonensis TaxID=1141647 RepID=UPI0006D09AF7|nr:putative protein N(5)-glutamine methyltransferase [Nocardia arizonensis]
MTTTDEIEAVVARLRAAGCVFAEEEAALLVESAERTGAALEQMVARRVSGVPLEHLVGWAEFHGGRVAVAPGVFVPRRRTGFLVDLAADLLSERTVSRPTVLDLCCGSGALGLALAAALAEDGVAIDLVAADIEPAAVACARGNLAAYGARVYEGDLFAPLPAALRGRVDILLCNTPYVPTDMIAHMPPEARDHEPRRALDGGPDGLDVLRRVAARASVWLAPGGTLLVEESEGQAPTAAAILRRHGLSAHVTDSEEYYATAVIGTRPETDATAP